MRQQMTKSSLNSEHANNSVDPVVRTGTFPAPNRYAVVYADPPWRLHTAQHAMTVEEMCSMPVKRLCASRAVLYLWAPSSELDKGIRVLTAWGFEYANCLVWDKEAADDGIYVRERHDLLLIGIRGHYRFVPRTTPPESVVRHEVHDGKRPEEILDAIEQMWKPHRILTVFSDIWEQRERWVSIRGEVGLW